MQNAPSSFQILVDRAKAIAESKDNLVQGAELREISEGFAYQARLDDLVAKVRQLPELAELERDLLPLGLGERRLVLRVGATFSHVRKSRESRPKVPLRDVLERLGFYHDILAGESPEEIWERVEAALHRKPVEVKLLLGLLGCDFPAEFPIFRCSAIRMSNEKRLALGSRGDLLLGTRGPEFSDAHRNVSWYLEMTKTVDGTLFSPQVAFHDLPRTREQILDDYWYELLVLGLCHPGLFNVSEVVHSTPGWEIEVATLLKLDTSFSDDSDCFWQKYFPPERGNVGWANWADEFYGIHESEWDKFQKLSELITKGLIATHKSKAWDTQALYLTTRWYLRGRLMEHPDLNDDEYNDVLLHYVTCLENLLMFGGDNNGITDKLACRCAWLVGRNDEERASIHDFVKGIYKARSQVVHRPAKGKGKDKYKADFQRLRDVCRRAMACALIVAGRGGKKDYFDGFLRRLLISQEYQQRAQGVAVEIGSLTRCF